jgi:type I restriction enzyme R subunit
VTINEKGFEDAIEASLMTQGGYAQSAPWHFDPVLGLDTTELFGFISATQAKGWADLVGRRANDVDATRQAFAKRLASELDARGTIEVLRHGIVDLGVTIRLAFFKPAHGLTPDLLSLYDANRVTVTRQLAYELGSNKTLDMALLVNGIPTATVELKNQLTNQNVDLAIAQYRADRDPKNVTLSRRALVHFAVDPARVMMTTKLAGQTTRFLPFNIGHDGRAGNPPNAKGHRTAYLWERVWAKDSWMDLLARFIHVERPEKGSPAAKKAAETVIFPRYHQWDAVRALESAAKVNGAGQNYLVQHSAGSGKSNTIGWVAHRLSSLHDATDNKIFDKVVVITDRIVLDRQLQDTIYQFEHAYGVVVKIDKNSQQLADALTGQQARIIITTLQKFPYAMQKMESTPNRRYAVIVDEAHSSQTGEAAKDLRLALGATEEQEYTVAEAEDAGFIVTATDPVEEALAKAVAARGRQKNLSFFAFTATPKARTLELFGTYDSTEKRYKPFHLYSMRQAVDEGFILDVLADYTTYKTFWRIEKSINDDPAYEAPKARRAIARFVSLHPHNLAQKAEIIVEHFRTHTAAKIGGNAKAMVVTSSRLHAVRYKQAIDAYIHSKGYTGIAALVAFSGRVLDDTGLPFTEHGMNGIPDSQTADRFSEPEYQVMIVAEKFQTGFDQPLLHTMYVDKTLLGLAAVQTLSRLNRIHPLKSDTFVLDFRNETEDIVEAFEPYYGETVAPPSDPNLLWDTRHRLDQYDVLRPAEIEAAVAVLMTSSGPQVHGRVYALLDPAVERFKALGEETRLRFKEALDRFVRTYSFLSQVVSFGDSQLERDYRYCRALAACLRDSTTIERLDLGAEVELTHLRSEITYEGSLSVDADIGEVKSFFGEGAGSQHEPDMEPLSQIIDTLNERFGLDLGDADQLLFDQFEETWVADPEVTAQAQNNTFENFRLVFDPRFINTVVGRMDDNEAIFKRIFDDEEFQQVLKDWYAARVYQRARTDPRSGLPRLAL